MAPTPVATPYHAIAQPRREAGRNTFTQARTWGIITAAAKPWATRATTSRPADPAAPHSREVRPNSVSPHR